MLILLGQASVPGPPGQRPLHDPAASEHHEAGLVERAGDDLQVHPERRLEPGAKITAISLVGPELQQPRQVGEQPGE